MSFMALSFEILLRRLKRRYVPPYLRLSLLRVSKIFKDELLKSMSAVFALRSAQILETTSWSTYNWPPLLKTSNPQSNNSSRLSLLDRLSLQTTNPETLRNDVTAGLMTSESAARTLSHCIWLLNQHPKIYEKLRQSVLDVVGFQEPTHADLNRFPYLVSVLNEGNAIQNPL